MYRVLHIVGGMNRGGIETFLMEVYRVINRNIIQFDFLVHKKEECDYDQEIKTMGGNIYYIPPRKESIIKNRKELKKFFRIHTEYKIIHMHESSLSYIEPLKEAKRAQIPIRIMHSRNTHYSGGEIHKYLHYINRISMEKYITHFFSISDLAAIWMFGKRKFNSGEVDLYKNGIDVNRFQFDMGIRKQIREKLNIQNNFVIGHVGRFVEQKNHKFLFDIWEMLEQSNDNARLLLIGDGPLKQKYEKIAQKWNGKVLFCNSLGNIEEYYNCMDVFVFPSKFEGLGRVLIEAQCIGLPCIASKDVIPKEVQILPNFKFLRLEDKKENWVQEILAQEKNRIVNSREMIRNKGFDITETAKRLENFYYNNYLKIEERNEI